MVRSLACVFLGVCFGSNLVRGGLVDGGVVDGQKETSLMTNNKPLEGKIGIRCWEPTSRNCAKFISENMPHKVGYFKDEAELLEFAKRIMEGTGCTIIAHVNLFDGGEYKCAYERTRAGFATGFSTSFASWTVERVTMVTELNYGVHSRLEAVDFTAGTSGPYPCMMESSSMYYNRFVVAKQGFSIYDSLESSLDRTVDSCLDLWPSGTYYGVPDAYTFMSSDPQGPPSKQRLTTTGYTFDSNGLIVKSTDLPWSRDYHSICIRDQGGQAYPNTLAVRHGIVTARKEFKFPGTKVQDSQNNNSDDTDAWWKGHNYQGCIR